MDLSREVALNFMAYDCVNARLVFGLN